MTTLHLFVSPHFDDAIGSCGGIIGRRARRGERVTILTVFGGWPPADCSDFARRLHRAGGLDDANAIMVRQAEDRTAADRLGVVAISAPLPDAVYRRSAGGAWHYPTSRSLQDDAHTEDLSLVGTIIRLIAEVADPAAAATLIHVPMGLGRHIDHRLVALAGQRMAEAGRRVVRYEDFWYRDRLPAPQPMGLERRTVALSPADIEGKIAAFAAYRSQIAGLYGTEAAMATQIRQSALRDGGGAPAEVVWTPPAWPDEDGPLAP